MADFCTRFLVGHHLWWWQSRFHMAMHNGHHRCLKMVVQGGHGRNRDPCDALCLKKEAWVSVTQHEACKNPNIFFLCFLFRGYTPDPASPLLFI